MRWGRFGSAQGLCHVRSAQVTGSVLDTLKNKRPSDASSTKCRSIDSSLTCEPRDSAECLRSLHFVVVSLLFDMMASVSRNEAAGISHWGSGCPGLANGKLEGTGRKVLQGSGASALCD